MRKMILGTDWWTDCDDAVALRMLARAHRAGDIELLGIGINACMEYSVPSLEGFLNTEGVRGIPLGLDAEATDFGGAPPYQKRLAAHAEKYRTNAGVENAVRLYRRLLTAAQAPVELLEIGYPQVLAAVLESPGDEISPLTGLQMVKEKVSMLWMMAGKWDDDPGKENNFTRAPRSRKAGAVVCEKCPVPITFLGWEVGFDVISGQKLPQDDVLYMALCDHGSHNGHSSWDPMLCLLALTGDAVQAGYGVVRGKASVDADTGENRFVRSEDGPHAYVVKQKENVWYEDAINARIG